MSLLPAVTQILQLEEWNHPNVVDDEEMPSRKPSTLVPPQLSNSATSGPIFVPTPPARKSMTGSRPGREPCGIDAIRGGPAS